MSSQIREHGSLVNTHSDRSVAESVGVALESPLSPQRGEIWWTKATLTDASGVVYTLGSPRLVVILREDVDGDIPGLPHRRAEVLPVSFEVHFGADYDLPVYDHPDIQPEFIVEADLPRWILRDQLATRVGELDEWEIRWLDDAYERSLLAPIVGDASIRQFKAKEAEVLDQLCQPASFVEAWYWRQETSVVGDFADWARRVWDSFAKVLPHLPEGWQSAPVDHLVRLCREAYRNAGLAPAYAANEERYEDILIREARRLPWNEASLVSSTTSEHTIRWYYGAKGAFLRVWTKPETQLYTRLLSVNGLPIRIGRWFPTSLMLKDGDWIAPLPLFSDHAGAVVSTTLVLDEEEIPIEFSVPAS